MSLFKKRVHFLRALRNIGDIQAFLFRLCLMKHIFTFSIDLNYINCRRFHHIHLLKISTANSNALREDSPLTTDDEH